jgi:hypothetical protein
MANFSTTSPVPSITTNYVDVIGILNQKLTDVARGLTTADASITNLPSNAVRWSPTLNRWTQGDGTTSLATNNTYSINISGSAGSVTGTVPVATGGTGATTSAQALINLGVRTGATTSTILATGTTAQRDSVPQSGYIRFNTTISKFEGYNGATWTSVGGGATGGGSDEVFIENAQTINTSYTIASTRNAMTTGPVTVADGVIVTISDGARWVVL